MICVNNFNDIKENNVKGIALLADLGCAIASLSEASTLNYSVESDLIRFRAFQRMEVLERKIRIYCQRFPHSRLASMLTDKDEGIICLFYMHAISLFAYCYFNGKERHNVYRLSKIVAISVTKQCPAPSDQLLLSLKQMKKLILVGKFEYVEQGSFMPPDDVQAADWLRNYLLGGKDYHADLSNQEAVVEHLQKSDTGNVPSRFSLD
jgi:hypothetical protein